jgi:FkbM family methyltransferase
MPRIELIVKTLFEALERMVRNNFSLYLFIRSRAVQISAWFPLESGFEFLKHIHVRDARKNVAIDIGSNDGTSLQIIKYFVGEANIVAFDPVQEPKVIDHSITFHNCGLGDVSSERTIFVPIVRKNKLTQYSSLDQENICKELQTDFGFGRTEIDFQSRKIQIKTLDSFGLEPFFIKVDVEGSELSVLVGGLQTILISRPLILIESSDNFAYKKMEQFFKEIDYQNIAIKGRLKLSLEKFEYSEKTRNYLWAPTTPSNTWSLKRP